MARAPAAEDRITSAQTARSPYGSTRRCLRVERVVAAVREEQDRSRRVSLRKAGQCQLGRFGPLLGYPSEMRHDGRAQRRRAAGLGRRLAKLGELALDLVDGRRHQCLRQLRPSR
jgi:hypothetical protein